MIDLYQTLEDIDLTAPDNYADLQLWLQRNFGILALKRQSHVFLPLVDIGKGPTKLTPVVFGNYTAYEFNIGSEAAFTIEMPHQLDSSESLHVHITWVTDEPYATSNAEVQWQVDYSLIENTENVAIDTPLRAGTIISGDINIADTAKVFIHTDFEIPAVDVNGFTDVLGLVLTRIALDGGVNPAAKPSLVAFHLGFAANTLGTSAEI